MTVALDLDLPAALHEVLAGALAGHRRRCELIDPEAGAAAGMLADFVLHGGKRLRPTFAWWGWLGAGAGSSDGTNGTNGTGSATGEPASQHTVLRAAAALELLHAGALLHDDVLDGSATRRGRPTAHVRLARLHRASGWHGDPVRFGQSGAILLGDLALTLADDVFRDAGLPARVQRRAGEVWASVRTEVICGQYLDVRAQATEDESEESALRVALVKSATYTVARPLQLGAAIAGAGQPLMAGYHRFGCDLGVAFQLRDDLLGVFGDPAVTGKPAGDDLREGKRTLLVALALRAAAQTGRTAAAAAVRRALGRSELTASELAAARTALVELGAVCAVERRIAALTDSALAALHAAPVAPAAAARLTELALAATERTS